MEKVKRRNKIAISGLILLSLWSLAVIAVACYSIYIKHSSGWTKLETFEAVSLLDTVVALGLLVSFAAILISIAAFFINTRKEASILLILGILVLFITFFHAVA